MKNRRDMRGDRLDIVIVVVVVVVCGGGGYEEGVE